MFRGLDVSVSIYGKNKGHALSLRLSLCDFTCGSVQMLVILSLVGYTPCCATYYGTVK